MRITRFAAFAWAVLVYNLGVVAWGAYVRATGSGAGCGSNWPLCNGQVIPRAEEVATLIEFSHRVTSGIALLLVVAMLVWARRSFPRAHPVRTGVAVAMAFMISEALVGAGLVLFGLVGDNSSVARAVVLAIHLVNTFFLLAFLALTAWWASGGPPVRLRQQGALTPQLLAAAAAMLLLGITGAIAALGDTLFPASSLAQGVRDDFSPAAHFLVRLRVLHPVLAVCVAAYLLYVAASVRQRRTDPASLRFANLLVLLLFAQLAVGAVNLLLHAPVWLQLVHLLVADLLWLALVLLTAAALADAPGRAAVHADARRRGGTTRSAKREVLAGDHAD